VVGIETVLIDRPRLDCRLRANGVDRNPTPVVLDSRGRTPLDTEWARAGREYVVVCAHDAEPARVDGLRDRGARVLHARATSNGLDIDDVLRTLGDAGFARVLVEGGPRVFWSFVDAGRWDAAWVYRSPREFGAGGVPFLRSADEAIPGRLVDEIAIVNDRRFGFVNDSSWSRTMSALERAAS